MSDSCPLESVGMQVGEIGMGIRLETSQDLTGASAVKIAYRKPNRVEGEWTAAVVGDPLAGVIEYITLAAGDLDLAGAWRFAARIEFASGDVLKGNAVEVYVRDTFEL